MFEIKEKQRVLPDGTEITTFERDIYSCNILSVEAGTTGYKGGDSRYGGRTYFRISDEGCTNMKVRVKENRFGAECVEVILGGDTELETIITALNFIVIALEDQRHEFHD